jgi:DNA polymerase
MNDEFKQELSALAAQIKEQLKFYRDIGIDSLGNGGPSRAGNIAVRQETVETPIVAARQRPVSEELSLLEERRSSRSEGSSLSVSSAPANDQASLFESPVQTPMKKTTPVPLPMAPVDATLEDIRNDLGDCHRCRLSEQRKTIVFGEGNPNAQLVFVGEGPGADEDASGRPFVGRAGQLLDKIIAAIGFRREDVYICNVVKCRPPGNRTPERDEVATCDPFLFRQLAVIKPKVIVALGAPAFQCLVRTRDSITGARGRFLELHGAKVMPTYHPAYLLRSPDKKKEVWEDMQKVKAYLDGL